MLEIVFCYIMAMNNGEVNNFVNKYNGGAWDFDGHYGAQCVDLFNFYNRDVIGGGWIGTPRTGGARDLWEVNSAERNRLYIQLPAGTPLQPGDVLVYGSPYGRAVENGKQIDYGHVRIYIGDGKVIQQNKDWKQKTTVDGLGARDELGVLRPRKFIAQPAPQPAPSPNDEFFTVRAGDTFWGLEEGLGIQHGTLQALNPGVDPRKLAIGQKIRIRASAAPQPPVQPPAQYIEANPGFTMWSYEANHQIPHGTLQALNPGVDPRKIQIGQKIRVK